MKPYFHKTKSLLNEKSAQQIESLINIQTKQLDKRLIGKLRNLIIFLLIMSGALVYETAISEISYIFIILGVSIGIIIGFLAGRMFNVQWHEEKDKVIARLDFIGIVIFILYATVSLSRNWIFAHWFAGTKLTAFTFSFAVGAMIGRIISFKFNIKKALIKKDKLEYN